MHQKNLRTNNTHTPCTCIHVLAIHVQSALSDLFLAAWNNLQGLHFTNPTMQQAMACVVTTQHCTYINNSCQHSMHLHVITAANSELLYLHVGKCKLSARFQPHHTNKQSKSTTIQLPYFLKYSRSKHFAVEHNLCISEIICGSKLAGEQ